MDPVSIALLAVAGIFILGTLGEIVFRRTHIPDVIWLIVAGVILGPILGLVTREQLEAVTPFFAALTLIVILFDGGARLDLSELWHAAPRATVLALAGFASSTVVVAGLTMLGVTLGILPAGWTWTHGLLVGTILGGSSSIVILPAMTHARVEPRVANLLSLESALTDALVVIAALALVNVLLSGSADALDTGLDLARSFAVSLAVGVVAGMLWAAVLQMLGASEYVYPTTLAALLGIYVLVAHLGGSAAFGILTFAVVLGNAPALWRLLGATVTLDLGPGIHAFHGQVAFIVKSFFFTFIGLMLAAPPALLVFGFALGLALLVARMPVVRLATWGGSFDVRSTRILIVGMPRGLAAGALATLPYYLGVSDTRDLALVVFPCVVTTILIFAVGLPLVRRGGAVEAPTTVTPPQ